MTYDASVVVGFEQQPVGEERWLMEAAQRQVEPPTEPAIGAVMAYFLVEPSALKLRLETTSGSVSSQTIGLNKQVYEFISFDGSSTMVELRYPKATEVKLEVAGKIVPARATPGNAQITVKFNSAKNSVEVSAPCVAVILASYRAPFDLWLAVFHQTLELGLLPEQRSANPEDEVKPRAEPMVIIARRRTPEQGQDPDEIVATLNLSPPDWSATNGGEQPNGPPGGHNLTGSAGNLSQLRLEIDPLRPIRLLSSVSSDEPVAGCSIFCVPGVSPDFTLTAGTLDQQTSTTKTETIVEAVTFANSSSISLRYQPQSLPSVEITSPFMDSAGHSFPPVVARPGESVTMVEWIDQFTFKNPVLRKVGKQELVACDMFGNAINAYGTAKVTYTISKRSIDFRFRYDQEGKQFVAAWLFAKYDAGGEIQTGTLQLQPPVIKTTGQMLL